MCARTRASKAFLTSCARGRAHLTSIKRLPLPLGSDTQRSDHITQSPGYTAMNQGSVALQKPTVLKHFQRYRSTDPPLPSPPGCSTIPGRNYHRSPLRKSLRADARTFFQYHPSDHVTIGFAHNQAHGIVPYKRRSTIPVPGPPNPGNRPIRHL